MNFSSGKNDWFSFTNHHSFPARKRFFFVETHAASCGKATRDGQIDPLFFSFSKIKSRGLNRHRTFDKASITELRYTGAITIGTFFLISFLLGIAITLGFRFFADP